MTTDPEALARLAFELVAVPSVTGQEAALADLVGGGRVGSLLVEKVNGVPVLEPVADGERAAVQDALIGAGFARTPRGLRLR